MNVKYNKYIDKIGVEFEGFFDDKLFNSMVEKKWPKLFQGAGTDGSLTRSDGMDRLHSLEMRTHPLTSLKLQRAIDLFTNWQKHKKYQINKTCGLHYHISLLRQYYPLITNPDFFDAYCKMFSKNWKRMYFVRSQNNYCSSSIHRTNHFSLRPPSRYKMVNYCYRRHGTVEFRGFGGRGAKVKDLAKIIQNTIDLIGETIEKKEKEFKPLNTHVLSPTPTVSKTVLKIPVEKLEKKKIVNVDEELAREPKTSSDEFLDFLRGARMTYSSTGTGGPNFYV